MNQKLIKRKHAKHRVNIPTLSSCRRHSAFSLNSPRSNNCPSLANKTLVPLENSITRLHKRFKIMVLSLCGQRERVWPQLKEK